MSTPAPTIAPAPAPAATPTPAPQASEGLVETDALRDALSSRSNTVGDIINQVENWSYSSRDVRVKAPVGLSYNSDIARVEELLLQATNEVPRVLSEPAPKVLLVSFGDRPAGREGGMDGLPLQPASANARRASRRAPKGPDGPADA